MIEQLLCEAQSWFSEGFPEENWCPNLSQRKRAVFGTFSPLFPEKGQGRDTRKVFRRKTAPFLRDRLGYKFSNKNKEKGQFSFGKVPENLNLVSFQKMVDKKNLFEGRATTQTLHFLFQIVLGMDTRKPYLLCPRGGIGRRSRFRIYRLTVCRFESDWGYLFFYNITKKI